MIAPIVFQKSEPISEWQPGLPPDEVRIWAARLDADEHSRDELLAILGATERQRADRFRFDPDRRRFVSSHVFLRCILGGYSGAGPAAIEFDYGPNEKPILKDGCGFPPLHFNMAHSEEVTAIAIAWKPVGIDVEKVRRIEDYRTVAARFFTRREQEAIAILPPGLQLRAFYACWTRKEAVLKATGGGLTMLSGLADAEFDFSAGLNHIRMKDGQEGATDWMVADFEPCEGAVGAIATDRTVERITAALVHDFDVSSTRGAPRR